MYPQETAEIPIILSDKQITEDFHTLSHDDRIDALQMSCYWIQQLARDQDLAFNQRKEEQFRVQVEKYFGEPAPLSWIAIKVPTLGDIAEEIQLSIKCHYWRILYSLILCDL